MYLLGACWHYILILSEKRGDILYRVINNDISIIRGDSATISLSVTDSSGEPYTILPTDSVTMMVRKTPTSEAVLTKTFNDAVLNIEPSDLSQLPCGEYVFDVQMVHGDGWTDTIIPVHRFTILPEVTYGGE